MLAAADGDFGIADLKPFGVGMDDIGAHRPGGERVTGGRRGGLDMKPRRDSGGMVLASPTMSDGK
jgi:hypothetical protein